MQPVKTDVCEIIFCSFMIESIMSVYMVHKFSIPVLLKVRWLLGIFFILASVQGYSVKKSVNQLIKIKVLMTLIL